MRITNNMIANNYLSALNGSLERQSKIQEQLSDGKAVHRPSDDPIKTIRSMRFNTNLAINEQLTQNVSDSQSWMTTTDGAMSDLSSIMIKVKELTISAADGTKSPDSLTAIGAEIDQLINQAVTIGNTKIGDRYIFAGQMDKTQPFERKTIIDPNSNKVIDTVVYNGDPNKISMIIKPGAVQPSADGVNLTGADVFGPIEYKQGNATMGIFNRLIELKQEINRTSQVTQSTGAAGNATIGGTYTGLYANFDVRIDSVSGTGQVNTASYSDDGGETWNAAGIVAGTPSTTVTLPGGATLDIATNSGNTINGTYSFRVPATNASGITVTQSNVNGGSATVNGTYPGVGGYNALTMRIDGVTGSGQVTSASYSTDGGTTWNPVTSTASADPTVITLPNGSSVNIATNASNSVNNTYDFSLSKTQADSSWISNVGLAHVDAAHSAQLKQHTQLGARMATYEMAKNMMEANNTIITGDISANEDLDFAAAIIEQQTSENIYKAALAVGAKLMPPSLLDYLN